MKGANAERGGPRPHAAPGPRSLEGRVGSFFAPDGPLAARKPGYAPRPQQIGYSLAVARAIERAPTAPEPPRDDPAGDEGDGDQPQEPPPSLLLADCPTGTGKTLASLVPVALSGQKAVYSTATIALQSQLMESELPLLARSLGTDSGFSYALMKGRQNYLCDNRLDALFRSPGLLGPPDVGPEALGLLGAWRSRTRTGGREDFPLAPSVWPRVASDPHDCAPALCRFREACFYLNGVEEAKDAQVLVVNHALLAANVRAGGAIFPLEGRVLIVDEAHRLREALSGAYGVSLSLARVRQATNAARKTGPSHASRYADAADWAAERFFEEFDDVSSEALDPERGDEDALPDPEPLDGALVSLRNVLKASSSNGVGGSAAMARQIVVDLRSFYKRRESHARAMLGRPGARELRSWLVDVAPAFAWDVASGRDVEAPATRGPVTVLCSATLASGSGEGRSLAHPRRDLGVNLLLKTRPGTRLEEHLADEAFDYERNALVYLERGLPEPDRDNAEEYARLSAARTAEILALTGGRALVLLSIARAVAIFREHLDVPYPVRFQEPGAPVGPLVEWLKGTQGAVLVGTRSLWEGVDVAGPQVSCVIVDKVPFPAPNDPVNRALVRKAGKDWFRRVSLPAAQIALRQGAGRLLRSASDRGVFVLLDPRVTNRRWGGNIVSSLPPAPVTHSLSRVGRFFEEAS